MKNLLTLFFWMWTLAIIAQIPSYYNDVNINQTGTALKDALAVKIINSHHTNLSYTPGVWNALKQTDLDPTDNTKVLLIYGFNDSDSDIRNDRTRGKDENGGGSGVWNREHVYSKSLASPNLGTTGAGADAHNLRPADAQRNSSRSNRKFAAGSGTASYITSQGYWYPGDEWKGDVARMMMYMYLRYGNQCLPTGVGVGNTVASDNNMIDLFLQWNAEDPVSDLEKQRNPVLQNLQGNRNPFIDNPAFATKIWGGPQAQDLFGNGGNNDTQAPTTPGSLVASNITSTAVNLAWTASSDNVGVSGYRVYNGASQVATATGTSVTVNGLSAATNYNFTVKAYDAAGNLSAASNAVAVTTTSGGSGGGSGATDLFISEYVEGSSYNKAIEIANFTGSAVNLSNYSLKKVTNGSGSWSSTLTLSGTLANGEVYVVAHGSASTAIKNEADITNNSVANFNGNDAVALFKGSSIIDLIGNPNSSANFGKDVTLQRKPEVKSPSTSYVTSQWNSLASNTVSGLGSHAVQGGGGATDTTAPSAPSGLTASGITQTSVNLAWTAATDNVGVTAYEVFRGSTKIATVSSTSYTAGSLTAGTNYAFSVKAKDAAGNNSTASNTVNATTLSNTVTYCNSKGNNASYEYIDYVGIGGISNSTASNNGYGNFTAQNGNIGYGSNTVIVSAGFSSSAYTEFWKVWIDYNQNGTFESSEMVASGSSSSAANLSYNFTVPTSAKAGKTRMRVSMKWKAAQTACESFSYGEVEDYSITIGTSSASRATVVADEELGNEEAIFNASVYPNPAANNVTIGIKDFRTANFAIVNMLGQTVRQGTANRAIDISDLPTGAYIVTITDGQKTLKERLIKK